MADTLGPSQPVGLALGRPSAEEEADGSEDGAGADPADIPTQYSVEVATRCASFKLYVECRDNDP